MRKILLHLMLLTGLSAQATGPYSGGSGDGYDDAYLELSTVITAEATSRVDPVSVYPNPAVSGSAVQTDLRVPARSAEIISTTGPIIRLDMTGERWQLPPLPAGVYLLRIYTDQGPVSGRLILLAP